LYAERCADIHYPSSEIIVPVLNGEGKVVGTIDVESERSNVFGKETEWPLEQCAVLLQPLFA
jgi:putative methionine-R-sulfoxide reductase with GAF domain